MPDPFIKPRYDSGGFAWLPQQIAHELIVAGNYDAVVLLLIDGFGWNFFERFQRAPFFEIVSRLGKVERITAQFPSTTTAQLVTLHTGKTVGEHGIFEWNYYEPMLDAIISPLLFSFAGTRERDTLKQVGVKPRRLFPTDTFYQVLRKQGVTSTIFQHREYTPSSCGDVILSGAQARGYKTLPEALVNLAEALVRSNPGAYFILYNDRIDAISHEYGPEAPQTNAEIKIMLMTMESLLLKGFKTNRRKILFLFTADHGQSEIDPSTTIYLNREPRFEGIENFLQKNRQGQLLVPGGSARDFFLYIKAGMVEEAWSFLSKRLAGKAEVRKVSELMTEGYFGPRLSKQFCARAGDLVILPYRNESVWWYEKNKYEQKYYGHHGGLTAQEMEIPLLSWEM